MFKKTFSNLHIHNKNGKIIHVVAYNWKYSSIVNFINLFLVEFEKMKCCIYRAEATNAGLEPF